MKEIGGTHYKELGYEPIIIIEGLQMNFNIGNAVKYLSRCQKKGGADDLRKALSYLQREKDTRTIAMGIAEGKMKSYNAVNRFKGHQADALTAIANGDLDTAIEQVQLMLDEEPDIP